MSTDIFPLEVWPEGILQARIPANDNSLRVEVIVNRAISMLSTPPGSPAEGDQHIVGPSPTGAWSGFAENDVAIYKGGTWLAFAPFEGWLKVIESTLNIFDGADWTPFTGGGGSGGPLVWNAQTGSYTLVLTDGDDGGTGVAMDVATANNLTVPPNSSVALPVGTTIVGYQEGAGLTTVVAGAGVTIRKRGGGSLASAGQYAMWTLVKRATDTWILSGDLAP